MARTAAGKCADLEEVGWIEADIRRESSPPPSPKANATVHRVRARAIADLAAEQHGRVSRIQLLQLGVPARTIGEHIAAGRLHIEHRGVYAVGHAVRTERGVQMAAVLACGPGAGISHQSGGGLHTIMRWGGRVHVTASRARGPLKGVVVHRTRRIEPADMTVVAGLPVTSWARTIVDLADVLPTARVVRLLEEAVMAGIYDEGELTAARGRAAGRSGARRLQEALAQGHHHIPQRTRSPLEERFLDLVRSAAPPLPRPTCNAHVDLGGKLVEVDVLFHDAGLVVELDSRRHHSHQCSVVRDEARDRALDDAGFELIRLTWRDVVGLPEPTIRRLRGSLARR